MKIANKIVFIGGIHGVGKGYICNQISLNYNVKHYSASEIIKWSEISKPTIKTVKDIDYTQKRLIDGLTEIMINDEKYLLDGHFCLLNSEKEPERVNFNTFEQLNPFVIAVVIEDIGIILNRLSKRDDTAYRINRKNAKYGN